MNITREEILEKLHSQVKESRYKHCLGVEKAARELAIRYGYKNPDVAALAGLLHDYAKEQSRDEYLRLIEQYQLNPELKKWGNNVWHGMVGWCKIKEDFPEIAATYPEILRAVEIHTVGSSQMTMLDKIVYVADYIEENRDFDGVKEARKIAKQSLDAAVAFETVRTVEFLAKKQVPIYPQTIETYNAFVGVLAEDE
ncbi:bis(5'-nucleosyl)-tetraphosphatase (symmetrical) YqeK [Lactococcus sp.]|uniref:bis(5'-nucleosyl)-tetraphosphatase (symmetrical) YqeK n=1 Tax=Lactococcus sp. TaxID=44273 RepID=UPI0035B46C14